jgi:hypothetical protein
VEEKEIKPPDFGLKPPEKIKKIIMRVPVADVADPHPTCAKCADEFKQSYRINLFQTF